MTAQKKIFNIADFTKKTTATMGKNKSARAVCEDGRYHHNYLSTDYYLKFSKKSEVIAELLFSNIVDLFIEDGILSNPARKLMVKTFPVVNQNGVWGLATPFIKGEPLSSVIHNDFSKDRSAAVESTVVGKMQYKNLPQEHLNDAALAIYLRLLCGDNSFHSGNFIVGQDGKLYSFDAGAAFRDLGRESNNYDLWNPFEYQGGVNIFKRIRKCYLNNFDYINGFSDVLAAHAQSIQGKMNRKMKNFSLYFDEAWNRLPEALQDHEVLKIFGFDLDSAVMRNSLGLSVSDFQSSITGPGSSIGSFNYNSSSRESSQSEVNQHAYMNNSMFSPSLSRHSSLNSRASTASSLEPRVSDAAGKRLGDRARLLCKANTNKNKGSHSFSEVAAYLAVSPLVPVLFVGYMLLNVAVSVLLLWRGVTRSSQKMKMSSHFAPA